MQMNSLLKSARHARIRQLIEDNGHATVSELSAIFEVSEATIRRDLEEMDSIGWIRREHGGALRAIPSTAEAPVLQRVTEQGPEKRHIGRAAAKLVRGGETVFIGSGTTTLEVARNLPNVENLTVITNALNIATELLNHDKITQIVIGGLLRTSELSLIGHLTVQALKELHADKVFLGMHAIDIHNGLTSDHLPEVLTDRALIEFATETILVVDHTKFGRVSNSFVAPVTAVDTIITDDKVPQETIHALEELGIEVIVA
jgi:DeoR/GlpR family transcriptional regulator of sugar metabolism